MNTISERANISMQTEKLSISLPQSLSYFVEQYQMNHQCKSRSEVIQAALKLLREKELEHCYRQAEEEIDPAFEITASDGLDDETW